MKSRLYSIGELANLTHASVKTIRYYDEIHLLRPKEKSEAGYRLYSFDQAQKLQFILIFKQMGFSLAQIKQILAGETDVKYAAKLQLEALQQQTTHLHRIQVLLESALKNNYLQSPELIKQIGEELEMNEQQRKEMVLDQLRRVMMGDLCTEEWARRFFEKHEEWLTNLDLQTKEQMDAFYDLKDLLVNPEFIKEMKTSMGNFWSMVRENNIPVTEWEKDMDRLTKKAIEANDKGLKEDSADVQALVDEWAGIISKHVKQPINNRFMEIFKERADSMHSKQATRYWEIVCKLSPEESKDYYAHLLLKRGLDYKLKNM